MKLLILSLFLTATVNAQTTTPAMDKVIENIDLSIEASGAFLFHTDFRAGGDCEVVDATVPYNEFADLVDADVFSTEAEKKQALDDLKGLLGGDQFVYCFYNNHVPYYFVDIHTYKSSNYQFTLEIAFED